VPRVCWPLINNRPAVQVVLTLALGGQPYTRNLLADTGAGSRWSGPDLLLDEQDCLLCGGFAHQPIVLGGAYIGSFPTYVVRVEIPALGFNSRVRAVAVSRFPAGFDGMACFRFLNQFIYGNFSDPNQFGLEK
jgi:hypothetical protein